MESWILIEYYLQVGIILCDACLCLVACYHCRIFSCERTMGTGRNIRIKPLAGEIILSMDGLAELPLPPLVEIALSVDPSDALWTAE
ncbi:hypothetical protein ENH_00073470 [Eimeria necatrix]|uniref:Uncharacterized protein n=1 Tax=Eimeria necatrix TaxID=51315 RepID=U6MWQ9_9EIME|nr:hypothetical protein ENH_00073470 [Eimeria necatrix]CDJ66934.1 hypothetical protein ENH_00073470 [Eimeria necatrix]